MPFASPRCKTIGCEYFAVPRSKYCIPCQLDGRGSVIGRPRKNPDDDMVEIVPHERRGRIERIEAYSLHPIVGPGPRR